MAWPTALAPAQGPGPNALATWSGTGPLALGPTAHHSEYREQAGPIDGTRMENISTLGEQSPLSFFR